ncbi:DUF1579 domain-containing protein [Amycolatopsis balhimycina DSM 5908]|uniref:DUF1579 domain-containing protein n=1 Tax=Amycolatopsis balhimycina DSM 5908 TaxID=1081091 RepID=A0A428X660_AMYBA|nr:DUF1579 family protein [Amycolatopsis balhimycina]RSM50747.1 DUF1579 domain-containing protein [Amycolatopsis balhimycina DSM 5908]
MTSDPTGTGAPVPHKRLRELDFFVGSWDAPGVFHETPFGPRKPIRMRIDGAREQRGFWITLGTAELPTPENPAPLSARYVWGYDPATGEFVADWYDSNGGRAVQRSAGWVGDRLRFQGTITMNGATVPLRDTFTRRGADAYHHVGEIDLGEGWIPVDEEEAVRA